MNERPNNTTGEPQQKFDMMTGEPLNDASAQQGAPVQPQQSAPQQETPVQPQMRFDMNTGQPLPQSANDMQQNMAFTPVAPMQPKKKKTGKIIGIVAGVAIVGGVGAFAAVKSGVFASKTVRVMTAFSNTFGEEKILQNWNEIGTDFGEEYTVETKVKVQGADITCEGRRDKERMQMDLAVNAGIISVDGSLELGKDEFKLSVPMLDSHMFVYRYNDKADGYLSSMAKEDEIEQYNKVFQQLYEMASSSKKNVDAIPLLKVAKDEYESLELKDAPEKTFTIDGKEQKCKGYEATIGKDNITPIIDAIEESQVLPKEQMDALYDGSNPFDELRDELEDMKDMESAVYIYDNKLATISLTSEGDTIEWQFLGGNTRMENMKVLSNDVTVLEIKGETSGSTHTAELISEDESVAELTYSDDGAFQFESKTDDLPLSAKGTVDVKKDGVSCKIDEMTVEDTSMTATYEIKKGVQMKEMTGEVFDVNKASESEWQDVMTNIQSMMFGNLN